MPLRSRKIRSLAELRTVADAWDDLWRRSDCSFPTARAELVAQWIEQFAPRARFLALAVEDQGRLAALLPLIGERAGGLLPVGDLPSGCWSPGGDLLLDRACARPAVLDVLVASLAEAGWPLLRLRGALPNTPYWQAFEEALVRGGLKHNLSERFRANEIWIDHDWPKYERSWSRNHRRALRRAATRAELDGGVQLVRCLDPAPEEIETLLRRAFEIEDRGWKGDEGTSILRTPGMFDFYCRQARQLAQWKQLYLTFLECRGEAIAFEYGYSGKGTDHVMKVGYDPRFASLMPGQMLRWQLYEQLYADPESCRVDYVGPETEATAKWATGQYVIARLLIAPPRRTSRAMFDAYVWARNHLQRSSKEPAVDAEPPVVEEPGAAASADEPLTVG